MAIYIGEKCVQKLLTGGKMFKCPHFREFKTHQKSKDLGQGRSPAEFYSISGYWCEHEDSPLTEEESKAVGSKNFLTCNGDIEKCPIQDKL